MLSEPKSWLAKGVPHGAIRERNLSDQREPRARHVVASVIADQGALIFRINAPVIQVVNKNLLQVVRPLHSVC